MKKYFFVFLLMSSFSVLADNSYYEISCEQQADNIESLTKLRDKGYSKRVIITVIKETYPSNYHDTLESLLDTVFKLKSRSPREMYLAAKNNCENYGQSSPKVPLFDTSGMKARGYLSGTNKKSCIELHQRLEVTREKLTSYERDLEVMDSILKSSMAQINSNQSAASNVRIEKHNQNARKFELLNREYQKLAMEYNTNSEIYNRDCGGKAFR